MRLREFVLAASLMCSATASGLGQSSGPKELSPAGEILGRQVAGCFTPAQSDWPDECVHIEDTTVGGFLIDSLSWQSEPIPVGLILAANDDGRTRLNFRPSGLTVRDVLNSIIAADVRYQWTLEEGVVNLFPKAAGPPLLDTRLAEFKVENAVTERLFRALEEMPEVRKQAAELGMNGPRTSSFRIGSADTRKFTVHCRDCTVREVLNSIVRQNGRSWLYREYVNEGKRAYRFWYVSP